MNPTNSNSMTVFSKFPWLIKEIQDDLNSGKIKAIEVVNGAYGDVERCDGIVKELVTPKEGGAFTRLYGCSFLFKGYPENAIVEGLALGKSLISMIPRKTLAKSYWFQLTLGLLYIFSKKWFWYYVNVVVYSIYLNVVEKIGLKRQYYNKPTNVLRIAADEALTNKVSIHKQYRGASFFTAPLNWPTGLEIWSTVACILEFVYLFLEYDNAYRFRLQYALTKLNKKALIENPRKELGRIFDILIENEDPVHGIKKKWQEIKIPIMALLLISKDLRTFVKDFLLALDIEEIALNKDDWYFCLNRRSSKFGIPLKERRRIKELVDKYYNHGEVEIYFNLTSEQVIEMNKKYNSEALYSTASSSQPISTEKQGSVELISYDRYKNAMI